MFREGKMCPSEDIAVEAEPNRSPIILLVEDETLVRLATADHLREAGFAVVEAANGEEARAVLEAGVEVSLIFTDVNMPGAIDGLSLAEWVGAQEDAPIIMLTSGVPAMLTQARTRCPNVRALLSKPYSYEELERTLRRLLPRADGAA